MNNEELAKLISGGRVDLVEELWNNIKRFVKLKAIDYGRPEFIDDMTQEAFITMIEAIEKYNSDSGSGFLHYYASYFMPKAFKVAIYGSRSKGAEERPTVNHASLDALVEDGGDTSLLEMLEDPEGEESYRNIEEADYWRSIGEVLQRGIDSIKNDGIRNIIEFQYHHHTTLKECSRIVGISYGVCTSKYRRGLHMLRRYIDTLPREVKGKTGLSDCLGSYTYYAGGVQAWKNRAFTSATEWTALENIEQQNRRGGKHGITYGKNLDVIGMH